MAQCPHCEKEIRSFLNQVFDKKYLEYSQQVKLCPVYRCEHCGGYSYSSSKWLFLYLVAILLVMLISYRVLFLNNIYLFICLIIILVFLGTLFHRWLWSTRIKLKKLE